MAKVGGPDKKLVSAQHAKVLMGMATSDDSERILRKAGFKSMTKNNADQLVENIRRKYTDANGSLLVELEAVGVDMSVIAEKLKEGLTATSAKKSGENVIMVPDFSVRHKYLETTIGVMGAKAPEKTVHENINRHEQTIAIVEGINSDPAVLVALQKRIAQRQKTIEIEAE